MDNPTFLPSSDPSPAMTPKGWLPSLFQTDRGLRSGWRLAIYVSAVIMLGTGSTILLSALQGSAGRASTPWTTSVHELTGFCVALAAAWLMSRLEQRPLGAYGLPLPQAFGRKFWLGALVGLCEVSALMGLIAAFGGYSFGEVALRGGSVVAMGVSWAVVFVLVGLFEEFLFRGYTQFTLAEGIGFWPAAVVLSVSFGLVHLSNQGEGWAGVAGVVAVGLIFCFALKRTGNLWFCVGLHAAFDYGETFLYSVPDSGVTFAGHLSNASLHGPAWLTGGSVGPEGSVFSFVTMGMVALAIHFLFPARRWREDAPRQDSPAA